MLTLDLYISSDCSCRESALAIAKRVIKEVPGIKLILRSEQADEEWAQSHEVIVSPTFVLEGEICAIGEPSLEYLVKQLRDRLSGEGMSQNSDRP